MLLNEHTALVTPRILLVPYSKHHVPPYHEWMQDEELQTLTASEPLTLPEEYAMQSSWRHDADKLTFITCLPPSPTSSPPSITPLIDDAPPRMLGDINLFLTPSDDDYDDAEDEEELDATYDREATDAEADAALTAAAEDGTASSGAVVGEIEIMIAAAAHRHQGYGRAALRAFLAYVARNKDAILREYSSGGELGVAPSLKYLRVKIGEANVGSIGLFESVGFRGTGKGANYFGEVELRMPVEVLSECAVGDDVVALEYMLSD